MNTVAEVLKQARRQGLDCSRRTFWNYYLSGFLPKGHKIPGKGNVLYFPGETVLRLRIIQFLMEQLDFRLSELSRYPWSQFECRPTQSLFSISDEFVLTAKRQYDKMRDAALHKFLGELVDHLTNGAVPNTDSASEEPSKRAVKE